MDEGVRDLKLEGVTPLNCKELGFGAYGKVYIVKYRQTVCAAKEIHSLLIENVGEAERRLTINLFLRECRQCSMLRHPNVIQFLGVYYPTGVGCAKGMRLPAMVMEMMADSLTSFVGNHEKIPVHIKYSIVRDVSLGLCYLHNHDPPIVHRDLIPNNVLLTAHHVAKLSDLGVAKVIKADSRKIMTIALDTVDFMPPESLANSPVYGLPMDVFSFAGIILHTFSQQWPKPTEQVQFDNKTGEIKALSEVQRRQQYLGKMIGKAEVLRQLVEECLDYNPAARPTIEIVCERIEANKDIFMKECLQNYIALFQQNQQFRDEISLLKDNNEKLKTAIEHMVTELLVKLPYMIILLYYSLLQGVYQHNK